MDSIGILNKKLGNLDLFLLDQILKERFTNDMKVLDAGCGEGRNLSWFLGQGFKVWGVDNDPAAIRMIHMVARSFQKNYPVDQFSVNAVEDTPFNSDMFDAVLCIAVLHFASSHEHFDSMLNELIRVCRPGGIIFLRTEVFISGISEWEPLGDGLFRKSDGTTRYLITVDEWKTLIAGKGLKLIEPLRTEIVDEVKCAVSITCRK